jgi:hypothetical protein
MSPEQDPQEYNGQGFGFVYEDGDEEFDSNEIEDNASLEEEDLLAPKEQSHPITSVIESWSYRSRLAVNESEKEFRYFQSFIELGSSRSIHYIAQLFNLQASTIHNIYKKNNWKLRASDYDRHMLAKKIQLSQEARQQEHLQKLETYRAEQEMLGRQITINAGKIAQLANMTLNTMLENENAIPTRDLPAMLNAAAKLADVGKQLQSSALGVDQLLVALEEADI